MLLKVMALVALACLPLAESVEEEKASATETAVSVMLLGSIGFQMLLFYLVNWPDRDIRKYSWQVISQTISIFCSVLLFQGFNGLVEAYVIKDGGPYWEVTVDMLQLVVWLTGMQLVLAVTSGAVNELFTSDVPEMEKVELNVKSWSVLFSHTTGFAAINAWGSLQQNIFYQSPLITLIPIPIGWFGLMFMYHGYDNVREYIAMSDDGVKDEFEHLWDEETEEAEHDVAGLSLSFLTVQTLRFTISGTLPNQEGIEQWHILSAHTSAECSRLLTCGLAFFALSLIPLFLEHRFEAWLHHLPHWWSQKMHRVIEILNNFATFGNAWCFFFGVKWAVASAGYIHENALLSVVLALLLSFFSFCFIFVFDKVLDNNVFGHSGAEGSPDVASHAVEKLITALGILIGFSWEQCFDTAVDVVSEGFEETCPPIVTKLVMSIMLVAIVFPAWRLYILKTEQELNDQSLAKVVLHTAAGMHRDMFMSKEVDEHALDLAHLKMKHHRRCALGISHAASTEGLVHLQVTASGIRKVESAGGEPGSPAPPHGKKKLDHRSSHLSELTQGLLA